MRANIVLSSLLGVGMLTGTVACNAPSEQAGAANGAQSQVASASNPEDSTGGWIGKTSPDFSLPDADGKTVDVGKVLETKPVVLVFYRGVW